MAMGTIDPHGNVTIIFNLQEDRLGAPNGMHWLPCESCGHVEAIAPNVVSFICVPCSSLEGERQ